MVKAVLRIFPLAIPPGCGERCDDGSVMEVGQLEELGLAPKELPPEMGIAS